MSDISKRELNRLQSLIRAQNKTISEMAKALMQMKETTSREFAELKEAIRNKGKEA